MDQKVAGICLCHIVQSNRILGIATKSGNPAIPDKLATYAKPLALLKAQWPAKQAS